MSERIVATDGLEGHWYTGEEIVRCRDCRHAEPDDSGRSYYEGMLWCSELGGDDSMPVKPNGFCAWGERK